MVELQDTDVVIVEAVRSPLGKRDPTRASPATGGWLRHPPSHGKNRPRDLDVLRTLPGAGPRTPRIF